MLPQFIQKSITNKIVFALFVMITISSLSVVFSTIWRVHSDNIDTTKNALNMLNDSIFQTLRNAMNTGDPEQIKKAEQNASKLVGVRHLAVIKSKKLIELYSPTEKFTIDDNIIKVFETKQSMTLESTLSNSHQLRMIKPMIATNECLLCHNNQNIGDVIGVIDLTFSLSESDARLVNLLINIFVTSTFFGLLTVCIIFYIVKRITYPIENLKNGFMQLIKSHDSTMKLSVVGNDEIAAMAQLFNTYMDKINTGLQEDKRVIEEASDVLEKTARGFFCYQVQSIASNPYVEELKIKLNEMIHQSKLTIDRFNTTMRYFSESKFDYIMDTRGVYGDLGNVASGIKLVGHNTSEMLAMIMNTGDALRDQTNILSKVSENLLIVSHDQASSLEDTTNALEKMTFTITTNTEKTYTMSNLADELTISATHGEKLASNTAKAMEEINYETSLIYESIETIDQIAFQTNILSLNAAVEAATAGEAGKGFAIVAGEVRNLANRSSEAAKSIKNLVESARKKASDGKNITDDMIHGYMLLNQNIQNAIRLIGDVAHASREQKENILQMNNCMQSLENLTQKNIDVSDEIASMASKMTTLSGALVKAASKASYLQTASSGVCDIDLVYDIAKIKVELLNKKDKVYSNLGLFKSIKLPENKILNEWLTNFIKTYPEFNFIKDNLRTRVDLFDQKLMMLIQANIVKNSNTILNNLTEEIENEVTAIFAVLNEIKKDICLEKK